VPALLGLDQTKAAIDAPLEVTGGVALRALANLDDAFKIQQPPSTARRKVVPWAIFSPNISSLVSVWASMNQPNRTVLFGQRAGWQGNGVIASQRQGDKRKTI
jgi:hypothetical protein